METLQARVGITQKGAVAPFCMIVKPFCVGVRGRKSTPFKRLDALPDVHPTLLPFMNPRRGRYALSAFERTMSLGGCGQAGCDQKDSKTPGTFPSCNAAPMRYTLPPRAIRWSDGCGVRRPLKDVRLERRLRGLRASCIAAGQSTRKQALRVITEEPPWRVAKKPEAISRR